MNSINGEVMVYPNPVAEELTLESTEAIRNIEIFNLDGRLTFNKDYTGQEKTLSINLNKYEAGIYYITIVSESARYTQKIVVH